ncbi:FHA domain-containing protein [Flavitalea antarctica]
MLANVSDDIITSYQSPFKSVMILLPGDGVGLRPGVIPCIKLSVATSGSFRKEFTSITAGSEGFLICWDEAQYNDGLCELLIHSIFTPGYLHINGRPVVVFRAGFSSPGATAIIRRLENEVALQGIPCLLVWQDNTRESVKDGSVQPAFINHNTLLDKDWFQAHMFNDLGSLTGHFILDLDTSEQSFETQHLLDSACRTFLAKQPLIANSLNEYLTLQHRFAQLSSEHHQLAERFTGAEKTIGVIRTKYKDDYENLFKWYHNEYEILPLWYKRFGHILKVIMGKRSFRSLFSDDVKKYKN